MTDFTHFARRLFRYPIALTMAMGCAGVAACGLGVGLTSLVPVMKLMLGRPHRDLAGMAADFNADHPWVAIPAWIVQRLPADPYHGVALVVGGLAVLSVIAAGTTFVHQYLTLIVSTRTVTLIRQEAFRHVIHLPLTRVVQRGPSEFVARVVRDATELQRGFLALTSRSVGHASRGLACVAAAIIVSWEVALLAPVAGLGLWLILRTFGRRIRLGTRGSLAAQEGLLRVATESLQGLRTVKANRGERAAAGRFHRINQDALHQELRARTARALAGPIVQTLSTFVVCGMALVFARRIISGAMSFEHFVVALGALAAAAASFRPLAGIIGEIHAAEAPAARLREILQEPAEPTTAPRRGVLPRHQRSIELDGVSFRYPGEPRQALDRVSLSIAHGRRVALVGPNGSGKTTLVSLLPRLLRPSEGRVLIDGIDVESVSLASLRRQIGVVTQEIVLFRGSVAENIRFGLAGVSHAQVLDAARRARADEFIQALPGGYDADVAEQGARLSGGQRQRLAIARALLRDPSILILDEATSHVDAESEALIAAAMAESCDGRTAIIIAHRWSTVMLADHVVVMENGRIVDQGTHEELRERCGVYSRLTRAQVNE